MREQTLADARSPSSAQFRYVKLSPAKDVLCGEVNAKNGFGGYVGYRIFYSSEVHSGTLDFALPVAARQFHEFRKESGVSTTIKRCVELLT